MKSAPCTRTSARGSRTSPGTGCATPPPAAVPSSDLGTYPVSFAHLLLGPPDQVRAWADLTDDGVDESTAMILGYDSGAMAVLSCSLSAEDARGAVVHGTEGRIEIPTDFYNPQTVILRRDGHDPQTLVAEPQSGNGYGHQAREVMRCLREKRTQSDLVPLQGTLDVMGTLDKVRELVGVRYPGE